MNLTSEDTRLHPVTIHAMPFVPGQAEGVLCIGPQRVEANSIVVLRWWEIRQVYQRPAAVIVVGYAPLAHPMIRLFGMGVPTVVVTEQQAAGLVAGQPLVVDASRGMITSEGHANVAMDVPPAIDPGETLQTADGCKVVLRTSVGSLESAQRAKQFGASGIGLVRSERFNPDDGSLPDTDFYQTQLGQICEAVAPMPVTVRLLDIAADKCPTWLGEVPGMQGPLGLKGVRLYNMEPVRQVVMAELEAINALAGQYPLSVMLPYVVHPEEFLQWQNEIRRHLPAELPVGSMVETPIAALALPEFLQLADFVAIGCNDLMQCLFAADRDITEVGHMLDPYSPFLYRFMHQLAESINEEDISRVQLCGLLSQFPGVMPIMLGLGYRQFSVEPYLIPYLAESIRQTNLVDAGRLAEDVCQARHSDTVRVRLGMSSGKILFR